MSTTGPDRDRLFDLLPVVLRERDAAEGSPLRALLRLVAEQASIVEADIDGLWEDLFIETCQPWVIPYIGDLVANRLLFDSSRLPAEDTARRLFTDLTGPDLRPPVAVRTRADVAKTIYYRRRKGTLPMLEELARDVTGFAAHAVEFFERLGWTQQREHFRPQSGWADVRRVDRMDRVHRPFDETSHTVDVRRIASDEGWHNIPNVGFFLYRLGSYPLRRVPARQASAPWRYHFSPLGQPAPLFTRWRREGDESGLATELHVPAPIRGPFFFEDLVRYRNLAPPPARPDFTQLYGLPEAISGDPTAVCPECSLFVIRNGVPVTPTQNPNAPPSVFQPQVICRQLDPWPAAQPVGRIVAIDVESGRLAIGDGWGDVTQSVDVHYHYGFPADLGGGPYERHRWLVRPDVDVLRLFVREGTVPGTVPNTYPDLASALTDWASIFARRNTVIAIQDSRTYAFPTPLVLRNEGLLVIEASSGQRPVLQTPAGGLEVQVLPPVVVGDPDRRAALTLSGAVVEGHVHVSGDLGRFRLLHATLVPGRRLREDGAPDVAAASLQVDAGASGAEINAQLRVEAAFSITGALVVPAHAEGVFLLDTVLDALSDGAPAYAGAATEGPPLHLERTTVRGRLHARALHMSESIATGHVETVRTQEGCVRFSYVPPGSRTPRRYRCQPDLAAERALKEALERNPGLPPAAQALIRAAAERRVVPSFTTTRYGQPAYVQLRLGSPVEIRTGAEDGSEMGAYCHVKQPQRESNLRLRLEEYLPFGLEAGILLAT
jgi:hypothetical protein